MCNKQKKQSPTMLVNCYEQLANYNEALNSDASEASILYVNQCKTPIDGDFLPSIKLAYNGTSMDKYYTLESECNGSNAILPKSQWNFTTPKLSIEDAIKSPMFTRKEAVRIRYLLDHLPMKRKDAEADSTVPYLPSFAQAVNQRLAITCGFVIDSSPACDGSRRKVYHFREVRENEQF